ncbi:hypothetical protein Mp_5g08250 [Marchantia polymorpha subsp. ruderalis]|uniref:Uncharacterized protein n=2 Tax=Marchantia polymorpha TaxID=3197 RepID=A0AAF6BG70_MARPO|nr:hypothetical protein MARPO_0086s0028 [Marchantia polymorpha]BBN11004.1 hypothetical protein Mp_5g08250 [Marchantia polymorpha subsp. ruderalis]|eukprot:PTQ33695.1 hypothetical protein MARPO_0086s0028 [Marchantia polymorpha]
MDRFILPSSQSRDKVAISELKRTNLRPVISTRAADRLFVTRTSNITPGNFPKTTAAQRLDHSSSRDGDGGRRKRRRRKRKRRRRRRRDETRQREGGKGGRDEPNAAAAASARRGARSKDSLLVPCPLLEGKVSPHHRGRGFRPTRAGAGEATRPRAGTRGSSEERRGQILTPPRGSTRAVHRPVGLHERAPLLRRSLRSLPSGTGRPSLGRPLGPVLSGPVVRMRVWAPVLHSLS